MAAESLLFGFSQMVSSLNGLKILLRTRVEQMTSWVKLAA